MVAIEVRVVNETPPKPTAITLVPAVFAVPAEEIAVLSFPPTVCTPSDKRTITFGTPDRAPVPVTAACPVSIPPDRNVPPPTPGALSSAVVMVESDAVRPEWVTTVSSNST